VPGQQPDVPGRRRSRAEGLLGGAAEPTSPRPERPAADVPGAVRRAALVVAVEALALVGLALVLLVLSVTGSPDSLGRALADVVFAGLAGAALAAGALGLWRLAPWARGPVVALQIFLGIFGYTSAFTADRPEIGVPVLVLVGLTLYLLATPEARLAYSDR
jgi:hypothetical protein